MAHSEQLWLKTLFHSKNRSMRKVGDGEENVQEGYIGFNIGLNIGLGNGFDIGVQYWDQYRGLILGFNIRFNIRVQNWV